MFHFLLQELYVIQFCSRLDESRKGEVSYSFELFLLITIGRKILVNHAF